MTPKLLSPEELADIKENPLHVHLYDAWLIVNTIAALEADNATQRTAMVRAAAELRHTYGHVALGQSINPDLVARAIRMLEEVTNQLHPGTTLLSEHATALVRARNEGLERAAGFAENWPEAPSLPSGIRALKETEG